MSDQEARRVRKQAHAASQYREVLENATQFELTLCLSTGQILPRTSRMKEIFIDAVQATLMTCEEDRVPLLVGALMHAVGSEQSASAVQMMAKCSRLQAHSGSRLVFSGLKIFPDAGGLYLHGAGKQDPCAVQVLEVVALLMGSHAYETRAKTTALGMMAEGSLTESLLRAFLQREKESRGPGARAMCQLLLEGGALWGASWTTRIPSLALAYHPSMVPQLVEDVLQACCGAVSLWPLIQPKLQIRARVAVASRVRWAGCKALTWLGKWNPKQLASCARAVLALVAEVDGWSPMLRAASYALARAAEVMSEVKQVVMDQAFVHLSLPTTDSILRGVALMRALSCSVASAHLLTLDEQDVALRAVAAACVLSSSPRESAACLEAIAHIALRARGAALLDVHHSAVEPLLSCARMITTPTPALNSSPSHSQSLPPIQWPLEREQTSPEHLCLLLNLLVCHFCMQGRLDALNQVPSSVSVLGVADVEDANTTCQGALWALVGGLFVLHARTLAMHAHQGLTDSSGHAQARREMAVCASRCARVHDRLMRPGPSPNRAVPQEQQASALGDNTHSQDEADATLVACVLAQLPLHLLKASVATLAPSSLAADENEEFVRWLLTHLAYRVSAHMQPLPRRQPGGGRKRARADATRAWLDLPLLDLQASSDLCIMGGAGDWAELEDTLEGGGARLLPMLLRVNKAGHCSLQAAHPRHRAGQADQVAAGSVVMLAEVLEEFQGPPTEGSSTNALDIREEAFSQVLEQARTMQDCSALCVMLYALAQMPQVSRNSQRPAKARQELAAMHVAAALQVVKRPPSQAPSTLLSHLPMAEAQLVAHLHNCRVRPERLCNDHSNPSGGGLVETQWASLVQWLMRGACAMLDAQEQMEVLERTVEDLDGCARGPSEDASPSELPGSSRLTVPRTTDRSTSANGAHIASTSRPSPMPLLSISWSCLLHSVLSEIRQTISAGPWMRGACSPLRHRAIQLCRRVLELCLRVHPRLPRPAAHTVPRDLIAILQVFRRQLLRTGVALQTSSNAQLREELLGVRSIVCSAKEILAVNSAHITARHSSAEPDTSNFQAETSGLMQHVVVETARLAKLLQVMEMDLVHADLDSSNSIPLHDAPKHTSGVQENFEPSDVELHDGSDDEDSGDDVYRIYTYE